MFYFPSGHPSQRSVFMPVARGLSQGDEVRSWRGLGDLGCHLASDLFNSLHKLQELCQGEDIGDKGCEVEPKCP